MADPGAARGAPSSRQELRERRRPLHRTPLCPRGGWKHSTRGYSTARCAIRVSLSLPLSPMTAVGFLACLRHGEALSPVSHVTRTHLTLSARGCRVVRVNFPYLPRTDEVR